VFNLGNSVSGFGTPIGCTACNVELQTIIASMSDAVTSANSERMKLVQGANSRTGRAEDTRRAGDFVVDGRTYMERSYGAH